MPTSRQSWQGGPFERFLHKIRIFGLEYFDRFYGSYEAEVTDNEDPDDQGRIKVKVPAFQIGGEGEIPNWAYPKGGEFPKGDDQGSYNVPPEGSYVWVEFENGDPSLPIYEMGWHAQGERPSEFESTDDRGWKTPSGHIVRFRDKDGDEAILIEHKSGGKLEYKSDDIIEMKTKDGDKVEMDPSGSVTVEHRGGSKTEIEQNKVTTETSTGTKLELKSAAAELSANASIKLKAPTVTIDGSAAINLGQGAASQILKGTEFTSWLSSFFTWVSTHTHITGAPGSPTSPSPAPPPAPPIASFLSTKSKTV